MIGVSVGVGLSTAADTLFAQVYTLHMLTKQVTANIYSPRHMDLRTTNVLALYYNEVNIILIICLSTELQTSCSCTLSLYSYIDTSSDSIPSYSALSDFRVFPVANTAKAMCSKVFTIVP